jgi:hypothetical protein
MNPERVSRRTLARVIPASLRGGVSSCAGSSHAYSLGVTRLGGWRGRAALVLALALLGWIAAARSIEEHPTARSSPAGAEVIEPVPTLLVTTSNRPVLSPHARLGESHRVPWAKTVRVPVIGAPASVLGSVRSSPSILSAGPVAQGLSGRGPPSSTNA